MSQQQLQLQMVLFEQCEKEIMLEISNHAYEFYKDFNMKNHCYDDEQLKQFEEFHDNKQTIQHDDSHGGRLYILKVNGFFAGAIRVNINFAHISHVYVAPKYRRLGLGRVLLNHAEKILIENGHKKVDIIVYDTGYQLLLHSGYTIIKSSFSLGDGIQHTAYKDLVC